MGNIYKNTQLTLVFLKATLFLLYINNSSDDSIYNIAIYVDDTNLYSYCDQASDFYLKLELASEHESDLQDTADWGKNLVIYYNVEKFNLFCLTSLITLALLMSRWIQMDLWIDLFIS